MADRWRRRHAGAFLPGWRKPRPRTQRCRGSNHRAEVGRPLPQGTITHGRFRDVDAPCAPGAGSENRRLSGNPAPASIIEEDARLPTYTCERPPALPWEDEAAFESFFTHEGSSLPEAPRLYRLAKRSLAERAYWAAVAHVCRGQIGASRELLKFALGRRPSFAMVPPVGYLFRREDTVGRVISVASEMVWRQRRADPARVDV